MTTETIAVSAVAAGDTIAFDEHEPVWVTALKVQRDRMGFDLLYAYPGAEPHWRGFDETDTVLRQVSADA